MLYKKKEKEGLWDKAEGIKNKKKEEKMNDKWEWRALKWRERKILWVTNSGFEKNTDTQKCIWKLK